VITRNLTKKRTCFECLQNTNQQTHRCIGSGSLKCNGWFHESCCGTFEKKREEIRHTTGDSDEIIQTNLIKTFLTCKNCLNNQKHCIVCNKDVVDDDTNCEIFQCPNQECRLAFHKNCLALYPQTNGSSNKKQIYCPQHTCHTCFYKEIHNTGPLMKCLKCPSAYHSNITCLPAGTKVLSQSQVICPRHPSEKELKVSKEVKTLNIDWCHMCIETGNLVCCDYCPNAFHPECINYQEDSSDEKFMCRECQEGRLPLYNSIVWTRVGTYRWWPGLIVPESKAVGTPKYQREFCLKFFGSNDFFWTSCERVYDFDGSTLLQKSGNSRLDVLFNVALQEATEWSEHLKNQKQPELTSSKPKPYTKIVMNRPIPPVKLRKSEPMQACGCKPSDPDPCGRSSDCINMHLNFECSKEHCPAGDACRNQKLRNRDYAELKVS
jgi:[histone H3]-lysine36 N-dimethyltransferase NSD2